MADTYSSTRDRLETYFDRTASKAWEALTSDAPVSKIRRTVREGREKMRAALIDALPSNLRGVRVLDAGCGTGAMSIALAERGADVLAVDISPSLLKVACRRTPEALRGRIMYISGDMLNPTHGRVDATIAMDSLIHYKVDDIAAALDRLATVTSGSILFTVAPRTPALALMHSAGQLFPRSDRSPAIVPTTEGALRHALKAKGTLGTHRLKPLERVSRGFYISQAMELLP